MKKVSLLGFILAATSAHFTAASANVEGVAGPQPGCPKAFQGFHLGGNLGYGIGVGKQRVAESVRFSDESTFTRLRKVKNDLGVRGVDGGVGVGYTHRFCNWALGVAFDANWAGTTGKFTDVDLDDGTTDSVKAKLRNSLQLYARLGYVMREIAMPFVALGWDNSQWKQTFTHRDANDSSNNSSFGKSKRLNAFLWKAGVDFLATKHVVVGLEYTGTAAGRKKAHRDFTNEFGDVARISHSFKPQYNTFKATVKIVY